MYQHIIELSKLVPRIASLFYTGAKNSKGLAPDFKTILEGSAENEKEGNIKAARRMDT